MVRVISVLALVFILAASSNAATVIGRCLQGADEKSHKACKLDAQKECRHKVCPMKKTHEGRHGAEPACAGHISCSVSHDGTVPSAQHGDNPFIRSTAGFFIAPAAFTRTAPAGISIPDAPRANIEKPPQL